MRTISCNLCGHKNEKLLFKSSDILYKTTDKIFSVTRCNYCGLVYLNPQPEADEIIKFYPNTYRPYRSDTPTIQYLPKKYSRKRVLDIGCGSGELLSEIAKDHPD